MLCIKGYVGLNLCQCANVLYPLGLNLFFQPGLGPGFFLILGSSGAFGLCLLLLGTVPLRALGGEEKG